MTQPRDVYPKAIIPEHLTKLTIEKLPLERVFYIEPGERDDFEPPAIFAAPDRRLRMSKTHSIDLEDEYPASPLGLVGVMKTFAINPSTNEVREHYLADLRFLGDYQLIDSDDLTLDAADQEEFMSFVADLENSVVFSAFIAAEQDADVKDKAKIEGAFYGDPQFYGALETMIERGNERLKKFLERSKKTPKTDSTTSSPATKPEEKSNPSITFSQKND